MCRQRVLQGGVEATVLSYQVLHLALVLFLEAHQHNAEVLEHLQLVLGLRKITSSLEEKFDT